jgi:HTH-type transcriptional regulator/antitoxin HipB
VQKLITTTGQVGEILRVRRKARKLPQQELANILQVSQSRLSTLECNPNGMTLDRLLVLLNLLDLELVLRDKETGASSKVER